MTDEVMAERRQLFLDEMARLRERERQPQEEVWADRLPPGAPPRNTSVSARRSLHAPHPRAALLGLMALCLVLTFPIFRYISREAQGQAALRARWQAPAWPGRFEMPDDDAWRRDHLRRARAFFGLPDIVGERRDGFGLSLLLRAGLPDAKVIAHARRVRDVLAGQPYPTRGPQPWRVGVCSADTPCPVAVVRMPGPGDGGLWRLTDGRQIIE